MAMDELEISGKRYISSKRIAREHKYHPDYMGQLIRAGKVQGTKVGRAWYVDEASFNEYLGQERNITEPSQKADLPRKEPAQNFPIGSSEPRQNSTSASATPSAIQAESDVATMSETQEKLLEEKSGARFPKETEDPRGLFREKVSPESIRTVEIKPLRIQKPTLTYISDSSPLFPEIRKNVVPVRISQPAERNIQQIAAIQKEILEPRPSNLIKYIGGGALIVIGIAAFAFTFFGSVGYDSVLNVEQGKPASVAVSQEKTFCFIFNDCQK